MGETRHEIPGSEKAEIIRLVEASHLPARRTLEKLGIPRATFYRWYDRHKTGGPEALGDRRSRPDRVWNRIPDDVRGQIIGKRGLIQKSSVREKPRSVTNALTAHNTWHQIAQGQAQLGLAGPVHSCAAFKQPVQWYTLLPLFRGLSLEQ